MFRGVRLEVQTEVLEVYVLDLIKTELIDGNTLKFNINITRTVYENDTISISINNYLYNTLQGVSYLNTEFKAHPPYTFYCKEKCREDPATVTIK